MTRRELFPMLLALPAVSRAAAARVRVPVQVLMDAKAKDPQRVLNRFWWHVWPEAIRDFGRCGIHLDTTFRTGEIWRPSGRPPVIVGMERGVLNLVLTDQIPVEWDGGRGLSGATTMYRGFPVCMLALWSSHTHQVPFLSVNTCVHEMLHAFLGDIFENRPRGFRGQMREARIDWYATRLWLFRDPGPIAGATRQYLARVQRGG
jgi:hypothetical protein